MVKILKTISDAIFVIVIIGLALYFVLRADNRIRIYNVLTGSMEDNIHPGDYILILKQDDYKVGDIITFGENGYYITHRIIKKDGNAITTKGDANNSEDGIIDRTKIIGKVILIGGILNVIINYKFGIVGVLLAVYLFTYYLDSKENANKAEKEEINNDYLEETKPIEEKPVEFISEEHFDENVSNQVVEEEITQDSDYIQTTVEEEMAEPTIEDIETDNKQLEEVKPVSKEPVKKKETTSSSQKSEKKKTQSNKTGEKKKSQSSKASEKKVTEKKPSGKTQGNKKNTSKKTSNKSSSKTSSNSKKTSNKKENKK